MDWKIQTVSKKFSIHSSSSSLSSFFFLPDFLCPATRRLNFLAITSAFFRGLDGNDLSVLRTLLKMLRMWLVLFLRLTLQCWPAIALTFFLNGILWHGQLLSSWTLRNFLALDILFFLFQFFFLRHRWPYTGHPSFGDRLYRNLCLFFLFTIFSNFLLILYLLTY